MEVRFTVRLGRTLACGFVGFSFLTSGSMAQPNLQGQWNTSSYTMPINPVHVALLHTGKVLVVSGSGNVAGNTNYQAAIWDPSANTIATQPVVWDMFCNGMVVLPDGRPFIMGGTLQYDPFHGQPKTSIFDPAAGTFTDAQHMAHGRWYPTGTMLGDGRVMVFSGLNETGGTNKSVEIYTVGTGWGAASTASWTPPLYPRMHLLPNGKVFYSGSSTQSRLFDPSTKAWSNVATTKYSGTRRYGTSVLLALTPTNTYDPRVFIMGGGNPSTQSTEVIDLGASTPAWKYGPNMSQPRTEMNAVILPTGQVLAMGGSYNDEDPTTASLNADLFDANAASVGSAGANAYARLYHSVALLLPDATVWLAGGNPQRGSYEQHMEIYQPPYLFTSGNGGTALATRPTISSAPANISYGSAFTVQTPDAANISSVVLVRNGAVTHAFDMDQRVVGLTYTAGTGTLSVTGPPNGNIAPPGYYMLFLLSNTGVPSIARFVQVAQAPGFSLSASPASQTVVQGNGTTYTINVAAVGAYSGTVGLSVSGLPTGATGTFNPTSITSSGSSTLTISTGSSTPAGSYKLTITGTDGASLTHTTSVTLVMNVSSLPSITPTTLPAGEQNVPYSTTLAASGGTQPYTWSITTGTLPSGLSLNSGTGVISGTPTASGTGNFTVQVTDANSQSATKGLSITIATLPSVTTTTLPGGTQNTAYSTTLAASGGTQPYTWSITTGTLPSGLSLNSSTGVISGTPTVVGTSSFTVQVTDANAQRTTQGLSITIASGGGGGAIGLVQSAAAQGTSVTSLSQAFPASNTAGNLIVVFVRASTTTQTVTVSDTAANTYALAVSQTQTTDGHQIRIFYATSAVSGPNTVTATFSATNNHPWLAVFEYTGVSALDQTAHAQGSGLSPNTGLTATTTSNSELIFAGLGVPNASTATATAGTGFQLLLQDAPPNTSRAATEGQITAVSGQYAGTFSLSAGTNWSAVAATFK